MFTASLAFPEFWPNILIKIRSKIWPVLLSPIRSFRSSIVWCFWYTWLQQSHCWLSVFSLWTWDRNVSHFSWSSWNNVLGKVFWRKLLRRHNNSSIFSIITLIRQASWPTPRAKQLPESGILETRNNREKSNAAFYLSFANLHFQASLADCVWKRGSLSCVCVGSLACS